MGSAAEGGRVLAGVRGLVRPRLWRALACVPHGQHQPLADGPDPKGLRPLPPAPNSGSDDFGNCGSAVLVFCMIACSDISGVA